MLPIIYQLLEHSTCSGRAELMLRYEKEKLPQSLENKLQEKGAMRLDSEHNRLEFDTQRDHTADRIYIFTQSQHIEALLIELFGLFKELKLEEGIHAVYIAHEDCDTPSIEHFLQLLTKWELNYHLIN